jgi:3-isopropylmalate/(R)-2-methylmalate dehydratase small subunit
MKQISGRALKYGDNINTDIISPPQFMDLSIEAAAKYAMSAVDPGFSDRIRAGDIFVAGYNLGSGSSRETSPLTFKYLGVSAVVAVSFARIFYRNLINVGLPAVICAEAARIGDGNELEIDLKNGSIRNCTTGESYSCDVMPDHIFEIIAEGGLVGYLQKKRLGAPAAD